MNSNRSIVGGHPGAVRRIGRMRREGSNRVRGELLDEGERQV